MFYSPQFPPGYDRLLRYYPVFYRDVLEMDELLKTDGKLLDDIQGGFERVLDNGFIDTADEAMLARLENFLHLEEYRNKPLDVRRGVIKSYFVGQGHIGQKEIKSLISLLTDGEIEVKLVNEAIRITITREWGSNFNLYDCHFILDSKIPAHLALDMVDKVLPVSVFNKNEFYFRDLKIAFILNNRGLIQNSGRRVGISFLDFGINIIFQNYKSRAGGADLSGELKLDGTWRLNSAKINLSGGLAPKKLEIKGFNIKNAFSVSARPQINLSANNKENLRQASNKFSGLYVSQNFDFTGSVIMDGRWTLGDNFILDGSRSLNQIYKKEGL